MYVCMYVCTYVSTHSDLNQYLGNYDQLKAGNYTNSSIQNLCTSVHINIHTHNTLLLTLRILLSSISMENIGEVC